MLLKHSASGLKYHVITSLEQRYPLGIWPFYLNPAKEGLPSRGFTIECWTDYRNMPIFKLA